MPSSADTVGVLTRKKARDGLTIQKINGVPVLRVTSTLPSGLGLVEGDVGVPVKGTGCGKLASEDPSVMELSAPELMVAPVPVNCPTVVAPA